MTVLEAYKRKCMRLSEECYDSVRGIQAKVYEVVRGML